MLGTKRIATLKGKPVALLGPEIKAGQKAPNFRLLAIDSAEVALSQSEGKVRRGTAGETENCPPSS